jgi:SAM-dependent methyltransferase
MLAALRNRFFPSPHPPPAAPAVAFIPASPARLRDDAGLRARSLAFEAGAGSQLALLDRSLQALDAAGALRRDQTDYAAFHRLRFAEALHAIATLLRDAPGWPACRVLEIGSSITPMLYHAAFPDLRLTSLCLFHHPQLKDVVERQVQLDLESLDLRAATTLPVPDAPLQGLDLVMLCEVLEHLVVNPANLFRALAGTLRPGGFLYVTTPNFLRQSARGRLLEGRNPQPIFGGGFGPGDRSHHHVREYTMTEVLDALAGAGLVVEVAHYSACWNTPEEAASLPPDAWQNLVAIGRRPA